MMEGGSSAASDCDTKMCKKRRRNPGKVETALSWLPKETPCAHPFAFALLLGMVSVALLAVVCPSTLFSMLDAVVEE